MGTDKMKILPVLAFASAHAYTVFEVDTVCDLAATPAVECGVNEWCTTDKKCACVPGYVTSTDGKSCAETIAEKCDDTAATCPADSTCDAATGVCDCKDIAECATVGTCDHFCNVIPVVEATTAGSTAAPDTGSTVAETTTAAPEGGSAMSYSLAISTLITLLL